MTDRIDLDELDDEPADDTDGNPGDWIWRDDAPPSVDDADASASNDATGTADVDPGTGVDAAGPAESASSTDTSPDSTQDRSDRAVPHVPRPNKDKPVGIPVDGGGAGGGNAGGGSDRSSGEPDPGSREGTAEPGGPHGGDADDMTLAFSFGAIQRFEDPAAVLADAGQWADWIGIVGDVEAHQINKFQRDHQLDVDFFNGTGRGPGERLADIDTHSMFFAERMVLVGRPGIDEGFAEYADWEFVPLETAAAEAGWRLGDS